MADAGSPSREHRTPARDEHKFWIRVDDSFISLEVACPYAADDAGRPCWPHHEDGEGAFTIPDDPPQVMCVYQDQAESLGWDDIVHGRCRVPIAAYVEWDDGMMTVLLDDAAHAEQARTIEQLRAVAEDQRYSDALVGQRARAVLSGESQDSETTR